MASDTAWMDDDTSWLDEPVAAKNPRTKPVRKPKVPKAQKAVKVEATNKIDHESIRGRAMFTAVKGRKRTWACDGQYVFFRRKNCEGMITLPDGTQRMERNTVAIERHQKFLSNGDYTYVETQDDVEVCKVNPQSPFFREGLYLGQMDQAMVQRTAVIAACKLDWVLYTDALTELAGRIKSGWQHEAQGALAWQERLAYIHHMIGLRGGPTSNMIAAGLQRVRQARGEGLGRVILMPPR